MLTFFSPAKVNLFFLILYKRGDGYHEIASLYQAVNLFDTITISLSDVDIFTCSDQKLYPNNLVCKARDLFRKKYQIKNKLSIHLEKKIPIQAGLGGGSSNAATTLWAMKELFYPSLPEKELLDISEELGSDVPFFFSKGCALCTGKGEKIKEVDIGSFNLWILQPYFGISTKAVYENVVCTKDRKESYEQLLQSFQKGHYIFINDLQRSALKLEPRLEDIQRIYPKATMTGSGSCFFSLKEERHSKIISKIFCTKTIRRQNDCWYSFN